MPILPILTLLIAWRSHWKSFGIAGCKTLSTGVGIVIQLIHDFAHVFGSFLEML